MNLSLGIGVEQNRTLAISPVMLRSLTILKIGNSELNDIIKSELLNNPLLESSGDWEPVYTQRSSTGFLEEITRAGDINLVEDLKMQLHTTVKSKKIIKACEYIISCIDKNGYLAEDVDSIAKMLRLKRENVMKCIRLIQTFEPYGICARSLKECLLIQLKRTGRKNACAKTLINGFLQEIANNNYSKILKETGYTIEEITQAVELIRTFNPKPGAALSEGDVRFIKPEVLVMVENGKISVEIINGPPKITISNLYKEYLRSADEKTHEYAKYQHEKARNLIKSVKQRYITLLRTARFIVSHQAGYFLNNKPLLPLTLSEIADELEMSVSTVSRALSGKYLQYHEKIIPFQHFLPSRLQSGNSSVEIKELIQEMIKDEDKTKPLSDARMMKALRQHGIDIALRTITKYRNVMGLPCASGRKNKYGPRNAKSCQGL